MTNKTCTKMVAEISKEKWTVTLTSLSILKKRTACEGKRAEEIVALTRNSAHSQEKEKRSHCLHMKEQPHTELTLEVHFLTHACTYLLNYPHLGCPNPHRGHLLLSCLDLKRFSERSGPH